MAGNSQLYPFTLTLMHPLDIGIKELVLLVVIFTTTVTLFRVQALLEEKKFWMKRFKFPQFATCSVQK